MAFRASRGVLTLALVAACATPGPTLAFGDNTPDDLRELVAGAWSKFVATFPSQSGCIGRVTVAGAWEFDHRAAYDPDTATITLRIPSTAAKLENSFVHELGHHLEFSCDSQLDVRAAFLAAQGLPAGSDWFAAERWEEIPSEQFAEAVIEATLGRRNVHYGIVVSPEAADLVRTWGKG